MKQFEVVNEYHDLRIFAVIAVHGKAAQEGRPAKAFKQGIDA